MLAKSFENFLDQISFTEVEIQRIKKFVNNRSRKEMKGWLEDQQWSAMEECLQSWCLTDLSCSFKRNLRDRLV